MSSRAIARLALCLIVMTLSCTGVQAGVDDNSVKKWIVAGVLNSANISNQTDTDTEIKKNLDLQVLKDGWANLKSCRDSGMSLDKNLAAAEHYLYARLIASNRGDTYLANLPGWYETLKTWATAVDMQDYLRTSDQPVSPPDTAVTAWGKRGIVDGLADYEAREKKKPSNGISTAVVMLGYAYAEYQKYYSYYKANKHGCMVRIR